MSKLFVLLDINYTWYHTGCYIVLVRADLKLVLLPVEIFYSIKMLVLVKLIRVCCPRWTLFGLFVNREIMTKKRRKTVNSWLTYDMVLYPLWPLIHISNSNDIRCKNERKSEQAHIPTFQHCLRMLHIMHTTIMEGGIGQSGSKPSLL